MARTAQVGVGLVELLVGLTIGLIVVTGALQVAVGQGSRSAQLRSETLALRELEAVERLLERLARQAVAVPDAPGDGFEALAGGSGLRWRIRTADATDRPVAVRWADGMLSIRFDGGPWQALHDAQALRLRSARFELQWSAPGEGMGADGVEDPADPCTGRRPPRIVWRLDARTVDDRPLPGGVRSIQARDLPLPVGCAP